MNSLVHFIHILGLVVALCLYTHFADAKFEVKPTFLSVSTKRPHDGELDYAYMTKDRGMKDEHEDQDGHIFPEEEEEKTKTEGTQTGEDGEKEDENVNKEGETEDQENTNKEAEAEEDTNGKKSMDDVPLATMQAPISTVKNKTDSSSHRGDTSTFVTNNFYNPAEKEHDGLTAGAELQYEYLWKRIYDIDSKLLNLEPIYVDKTKDPLRRKGLTITFDAESNPDQHTVNIDDSVAA